MSYPELQTRHNRQFNKLAGLEAQLKQLKGANEPSSDANLTKQIQALELSILEVGAEVKDSQTHLRIREVESQANSLRNEISKARKLQRGIRGLFRSNREKGEVQEQRLMKSLDGLKAELQLLKTTPPSPRPARKGDSL
ncbi:hypothetical protein EOPP23_20900 [Endozoicomonas sp. OPT23]|uniref:hypothetical protein n=1 Tax=Endozoicomonas sp. OPT23 TaxID=2072845 RepID=UPI00129B10AA|nr:hypothetical protein [Endozoicomonas sp. OPT23]MRI35422.1 hypothetical protein [Endozoicomonas sp. OPT23]